jgi:hypothetical protein
MPPVLRDHAAVHDRRRVDDRADRRQLVVAAATYHRRPSLLCSNMHGPSAIPLLVELAATAIVLSAALARKPLARAARAATSRLAERRRRRRLRAATH